MLGSNVCSSGMQTGLSTHVIRVSIRGNLTILRVVKFKVNILFLLQTIGVRTFEVHVVSALLSGSYKLNQECVLKPTA